MKTEKMSLTETQQLITALQAKFNFIREYTVSGYKAQIDMHKGLINAVSSINKCIAEAFPPRRPTVPPSSLEAECTKLSSLAISLRRWLLTGNEPNGNLDLGIGHTLDTADKVLSNMRQLAEPKQPNVPSPPTASKEQHGNKSSLELLQHAKLATDSVTEVLQRQAEVNKAKSPTGEQGASMVALLSDLKAISLVIEELTYREQVKPVKAEGPLSKPNFKELFADPRTPEERIIGIRTDAASAEMRLDLLTQRTAELLADYPELSELLASAIDYVTSALYDLDKLLAKPEKQ